MDLNRRNKVKALLQNLIRQIPPTLSGLEKQKFISDELINKLDRDERGDLKSFIDDCLVEMRELDASDIDLGGWGSKGYIWLRIQGFKKPMDQFGTFTVEETDLLIQNLLMESQQTHLINNMNLDFSYIFKNQENTYYRHRANTYLDLDALALNMRAISTDIRPYDSYGFHSNLLNIASLGHSKEGLILITGITGSGKSCTLDAIIDLNNNSVDAHIIVIASPVEFVHDSKKCLIRHREVGRDTKSFKNGTIEALRQDPDIIIIGEMRDPETIMAGLEVADSGHKVLSTLHTSSAIESIDRIIGEMPVDEQDRMRMRLADVLRLVVSQKLIPSSDGKRVLAKEVMVMSPPIKAAIKNNNTGEIYQMINEGSKIGMITMEQDLRRLTKSRKITSADALNYANNKIMMKRLLQSY